MEYLDLYDKNKKLTGKKILRGVDEIPKDNYINIVVIFIENSKGEFLIQKTSIKKGSIWATTGGHVKSGQTSKEAIIEETKEELGIDISKEKIKLIVSKRFDDVFIDSYYLKKDINIDKLLLQKEEVELVKWLSIDEINKLIKENKFRESNIEFLKLIIGGK